MKQELKNNYKPSRLKDGFKYRMQGTCIIGISEKEDKTRLFTFSTYSQCRKEFNRLTAKQPGRPKEMEKIVAHKGDAI